MDIRRSSFSFEENPADKKATADSFPLRQLSLTEKRMAKRYSSAKIVSGKIEANREEEFDLEEANFAVKETIVKRLESVEFLKDSFDGHTKESSVDHLCNLSRFNSRQLVKLTNISDSLAISENEENEYETFVELFTPESRFLMFFRLFLIALLLYILNYYPKNVYVNRNMTDYTVFFQEILCIIDIYLHFNTQQYDEEENLIIIKKEVSAFLFKSGIVYDILVSCPFFSVFLLSTLKEPICSNQKVLVLTFSTLFKLCKLYLLCKWVLSLNNVRQVMFRMKSLNLASYYLTFLVMFLHLNSLFFLLNSMCHSDSWVHQNNLTFSSFMDKYIASLYFTVTTILTVGYGDLEIANLRDKVFVVILLLIGIILYSLTLASLSSSFASVSKKKKKLKDRMEYLAKAASNYNLDQNLFQRVKNHLFNDYKYKKNDFKEFFKGLPYTYVLILKKQIYKEEVSKLKFLKGKIKEFQFMVMDKLKESCCVKGDMLIEEKERVDEIIILREGMASVKMKVLENKISVFYMHKHEHFGDIYMDMNILSPFSLVVKSKICKIYLLSKEDFKAIKKLFPKIIDRILKVSLSNTIVIENRAVKMINSRADKVPHKRRQTIMNDSIVCSVKNFRKKGKERIIFKTDDKLKLAGRKSPQARTHSGLKKKASSNSAYIERHERPKISKFVRKSKISKTKHSKMVSFGGMEKIVERSMEESMIACEHSPALDNMEKLDKVLDKLERIKHREELSVQDIDE